MTSDPRRIVQDLENKVLAEEGGPEMADDLPTSVAEDVSPGKPGVEPTD